jgi:acyl-CoA thioester hydrolase
VLAKHYVADPGRSSFDTYITLERTDQPGLLHAGGGAKVVWVDYAQQKSLPLPAWLRDRVSQ